jgi:3' terminal RNA ribose 2'-O-methyltransferase Hen1
MLLTITMTHRPATDLGYLLHKHPAKLQEFELSFGKVHVFFPEANEECCTAALLIYIDPVSMVRGKGTSRESGLLDQYVNDRPYAASSFLSVAIARVFSSALHGRCKDKPELTALPIPLKACIHVLPCRSGEGFLRSLFEPLGYVVNIERCPLEKSFPEWGESPYYRVELEQAITLARLLAHLYVLVPVLDNYKHYYIGDDEVEKLLAAGEGWLARHPMREAITRRYLKFQPGLARQALMRLSQEEAPLQAERDEKGNSQEEELEKRFKLNDERLVAVLQALRESGAERVLDLGCGEGKLLQLLVKERQFKAVMGVDVSMTALTRARDRLSMDMMPAQVKERITLQQGSLMYRDRRLDNFDAAAVVEVIEHLDRPRLRAFERTLFEFARPRTVVLTTPNAEFNPLLTGLLPGKYRHGDHRFEWNREEFRNWALTIAVKRGYEVSFQGIGPGDPALGSPTQMALFTKRDEGAETAVNPPGARGILQGEDTP